MACLWQATELALSAISPTICETLPDPCKESEKEMDEARGLQVISVRLPKRLIAQLKLLAGDKVLSYQPYLLMVLMDQVKATLPRKKSG